MDRITTALERLGIEADIITWSDAPDGGDAADYIGDATVVDVERLIAEAEPAQPVASASGDGLRFYTPAELLDRDTEQVEWVIPWYAVLGAITLLIGLAKETGKTTFVLRAVHSVLTGGTFLGQDVQQGAVVYLTEERPSTFRRALLRAGLQIDEQLRVLLWQDAAALPWPETMKLVAAECRRVGARLLVVDTLPQWAGLIGDAENSAGEVLEALVPLQRIAAEGVAIVINVHSRKGGLAELARGSSALAGVVDILMQLRPDARLGDNVRVIEALGRIEETPRERAVELTRKGYEVLGSASDAREQGAQRGVLDVLPRSADEAVTVDEIVEALDGAAKQTAVTKAVAASRSR